MSIIVTDVKPNVIVTQQAPGRVIVTSPGISAGGGGGSGGITPGDTFDEPFTQVNLAAGASHSFDATLISTGRHGRLWSVSFGASVPLRLDIEFVNGSRVIRDTVYKLLPSPDGWYAPDPRFFRMLGDGAAKFGCTVTNLDVNEATDVHVTIYWDEVDA